MNCISANSCVFERFEVFYSVFYTLENIIMRSNRCKYV